MVVLYICQVYLSILFAKFSLQVRISRTATLSAGPAHGSSACTRWPVRRAGIPQCKPSPSQNNDPVPAVKQFDVGSEYAEIVYRHLSDNVDTDEDDDDDIPEESTAARAKKAGKKRRPHARRAHWQHYWTGEGRKNLELRWKSDLFVGASRDDQATVVYEVSKEPLKGKRNPNTSKKKRNK